MLEQAFQAGSAARLRFHTRLGGTERDRKWPKVTGQRAELGWGSNAA